ncbi:GntR family transcriptional regulator [Shinella sp.]|uniref:GntR family transcriptional regulator n=1 Tax=Shinella sp. TaxID=1870904 RepID=UPI0025828132|nr:GntR family transcriptional regulator [Shinella sp.]MCW5710666.1 GntR family transcriptional regulator [Shinella sp.]
MSTFNFKAPVTLGGSLQDRVRRSLAGDIESGKYLPGDQLPTERELAGLLGVSLAPVRGALDQLAQIGLVVRRQGKGTFVSDHRVPYRLETWNSCTDDLRRQKIPFSVTVLGCVNALPPADVARALGMPAGESAFNLVRMVRVDDKPGIFLDSWVKGFDGGSQAEMAEYSNGQSLYRQMSTRGFRLTLVETSIVVSFADEVEAELFDVSYGTAQLQVTGLAFDADGPREWSRLKYNAAIFSLNTRRHVDPGE